MTNWNDPVSRAELMLRVGLDTYNAEYEKFRASTVLETVNGHDIRPVPSRFGRLFAVGLTGTAFATLDQATTAAMNQPSGPSSPNERRDLPDADASTAPVLPQIPSADVLSTLASMVELAAASAAERIPLKLPHPAETRDAIDEFDHIQAVASWFEACGATAPAREIRAILDHLLAPVSKSRAALVSTVTSQ